ncbi:MAG: metal-dependent transcriptional regulator, partial [Actinomycetota bacterium]
MASPAPVASSEYLEAIFEMAEEGIPTVQARVADWMGVSAPSVSEAVKRLTRDGLVHLEGRELRFTPEGEAVAISLVRRHRLAEHFLIRIIGLPWHKAHEEAGRWERAISDDVELRMVEILDDPGACPHGNPIPGSAHRIDLTNTFPLNRATTGDTVVLRRLTEDLELELDVMRFFEDAGLMPGATITVGQLGPDGSMMLSVRGHAGPTALGPALCDNL